MFKDFQIKTNNAEVIHQDSTPLPIFKKKINSFAKTYFFLFYPYNKNRIENNNDKQKYEIISSDLKEYKALFFLSKLNTKYKNKNIFMKISFSFIYYLSGLMSFILTRILIITDKMKFLYSYKLYKALVHIVIINSSFGKEEINKEWLELN